MQSKKGLKCSNIYKHMSFQSLNHTIVAILPVAKQAGHLHVYGTTRKAFCADPRRYGSAPEYAVDLP